MIPTQFPSFRLIVISIFRITFLNNSSTNLKSAWIAANHYWVYNCILVSNFKQQLLTRLSIDNEDQILDEIERINTDLKSISHFLYFIHLIFVILLRKTTK